MAFWPTTLPAPLKPGYGLDPEDQQLRTDMEVGAARVRRRTRARKDMLDVVWKFADAQMALFRKWFDNDGSATHSGTAQSGGASTVTLASGASASNDTYNDSTITITGGTGAGQTRKITGYVGATRVATVDAAWATQPDETSTYDVSGGAAGGAAWFTVSLPLGDGGLSACEARFKGGWKSKLGPGMCWQVTATLEVR